MRAQRRVGQRHWRKMEQGHRRTGQGSRMKMEPGRRRRSGEQGWTGGGTLTRRKLKDKDSQQAEWRPLEEEK